MDKPTSVYDAYWWIINHPALISGSNGEIEIRVEPHLVNSKTKTILPVPLLNTEINFWLEICSKRWDLQERKYFSVHHWELDVGGKTYDEAIWNAYAAVIKKYGDYTEETFDKEAEVDPANRIIKVPCDDYVHLDMDKIFYPLTGIHVSGAAYSPYIRGDALEPVLDDSYNHSDLDDYEIKDLEYEITRAQEVVNELQKYSNMPKRTKEYVDATNHLVKWFERKISLDQQQIKQRKSLK